MSIEKVELFIQWKTESGDDNWLFFDCVEAVTHTLSAEYSNAPREDGSPVADHAFNKPDSLSVAGIVSNTPLPSNTNVGSSKDEIPESPLMSQQNIPLNVPQPPPPKSIGSLAATGARAITNAVGLTEGLPSEAAGVWVADRYLDRVQAAFNDLRDIKRGFLTCTIRTPLWVYEGMQIASINIPEIPADGSTRTFSIEFIEAFTASISLVEAPEPTVIRAKPPSNKSGSSKDAKNADKKNKVKQSWVAGGVDAVGDGISSLFGL